MEQKDVIDLLRRLKKELQRKYSIQKIGVFGSFARNTQTDKSDVDIVVQMDSPDMFALIGVKQDLEEKLHRKVDIVRIRDKMNIYLKHRIEHEAKYV